MSGRWRDLAGPVGVGPIATGPRNAITDVPGIRVGQAQAASGQRTGITVVAPPELPTPAATATVNGVGELTAKLEIDERGRMETPVYLCGSHAIGTVLQAAIVASGRGPDNIVLPVVGECDDGDLADSRIVERQQVAVLDDRPVIGPQVRERHIEVADELAVLVLERRPHARVEEPGSAMTQAPVSSLKFSARRPSKSRPWPGSPGSTKRAASPLR